MNSLKQTAEAVRNQYSDLITLLGNFIAENCRNVMVLAALIALAIEEAFETLTDRLCNAGKNERSKKREGYRNGHKDVDYKLFGYVFSVRMPIVTGKDEPSVYPELKRQAARQTSATELGLLLVKKGLSYKDAADVASRFLGESVSRASMVNWLGPVLDREVEEFRERDLSLIENVIMFVDALYRACMVGGESEKMAQYVSTCIEGTSGERVLLDVSVDTRESTEAYVEVFEEMKRQGANDPKFVVGDHNPSLIKAVGVCFPNAMFISCWFHFIKNLVEKLDKQGEYDPSKPGYALVEEIRGLPLEFSEMELDTAYEMASEKGDRIMNKYEKNLPDAVEWLRTRLRTALIFLTLPLPFRYIYTNNFTERLQEYFRRREDNVACFPSPESFEKKSVILLNEVAGDWKGREIISPVLLKEAVDCVDDNLREIEEVFRSADGRFHEVNDRDLSGERFLAVWPHVFRVEVTVDQRPREVSLLVPAGLRARDGRYGILGLGLVVDDSVESFRTFLEDLLNRGLDRSRLLFAVTSGRHVNLDEAVRNVFDGVDVQQNFDHFFSRIKYLLPDSKAGDAVVMALKEALGESGSLEELDGKIDFILGFLKGQKSQYRPVVEYIEGKRREVTAFMKSGVPALRHAAEKDQMETLCKKLKEIPNAGKGMPNDTYREFAFAFETVLSMEKPRRGRPRKAVLSKEELKLLSESAKRNQ